MKSLIIIASLATLAGCADYPTAYNNSGDPREWRTVSVTNVDLPPGAARPNNYTSVPVDAATYPYTYSSPGAYSYGPRVYSQPYWNQPQISLGLGFGVGRHGWLGINQTWGGYSGYGYGYPGIYAPYSYWPYRSYYRPAPRYIVPRHHYQRHDGWRRDGRRDGRRGRH